MDRLEMVKKQQSNKLMPWELRELRKKVEPCEPIVLRRSHYVIPRRGAEKTRTNEKG